MWLINSSIGRKVVMYGYCADLVLDIPWLHELGGAFL